MKSSALVARDIARELAMPYMSSTNVDTVVCMDKTETIGAFLANELLSAGVNRGNDIHVVTPISNVNNNLVFKDSMLEWISGKSIILLVAMMISGRAVDRAMECLDYYGANVVGTSALFMAVHGEQKHKINALFTSDDISGYKLFSPGQCEMCKAGLPLDAMVSTEGYTYIRGNN
jgi:orotate phosphoribosyltransferase